MRSRGGYRAWAVVTIVSLLGMRLMAAETSRVPGIRIGILGTPDHRIVWTDQSLERLKAIGFNEVQINIGWGSRPFGEALNLANVVTAPGETEFAATTSNRAELKRRVGLAARHGLRMLFLFGSPHADYNPSTGEDSSGGVPSGNYHLDSATEESWYDVMNPKVREHELALLREFRRQFPDVEDILVYTYDNHAWQTPEFQYTQDAYGVPLDERLPGYLSELQKVWTERRRGAGRLWWEPWELSAGQVYAMLDKLPRSDFGLIIHSNIAEAQLAQPVDVWVRNTARISRSLGIPVVMEGFFASSTEEIAPLAIPALRLVDEQYKAFIAVPGVVGIKEYYGLNTEIRDLDLELLQARLHHPTQSTDDLMSEVTKRFGAAQSDVERYLGLLSDALQLYPWDASWFAREIGRASIDHGWAGATIQGASWPTPAWQSTRKARFMKTDDSQPHFWMLEDVELRCKLTADVLDQATGISAKLLGELENSEDKTQFQRIQTDVDQFRRVSRSYQLHLRETNIAQMLRQDLAEQRPLTPGLVTELGQLLDQDIANQDHQGRVVEMRALYKSNPEVFVQHYLIPNNTSSFEKGMFSLTTR